MKPVANPQSNGRSNAGDLIGGEYPFTEQDFRSIARMLHADVGITLSDTKAPLVYARLVKRLRALGLQSFKDYCAMVGARSGAGERRHMAAALTTNVTRFFREPHHFEFLKQHQLPGLIDLARRGRRVRLWSAGCSSGEEAYSIALTLLEAAPDVPELDIKILATDVDEEMLEHARAGAYSDAAVAPIDRELRNRWFKLKRDARGERCWRVGEALRGLVAFRELNLIGRWPMRGPFQAIFCRNVTIYFENDIQIQVWRQMAPLLAPGGCFYIGHSERIVGVDGFRSMGMTVYQRIGEDLP
ncbi:MAG TPA: protein-glutamate O-methyltransferase [Caulobacteraceae bacterium]|nr:protein-glutamate O-methyltransferase [Caulobacteraceae bacterium]